jgi:hypothetical protein
VDTQCRLQRLRVLNKSRFGLLSARVMFNHCSIAQCSCDPSCLLLQLLHTPWFDTPRTPIFVDASLTFKRTTALLFHCHHCFLGYNSIQFNSTQFDSIQFNSIQFNSIQFNSIQFNSIQFNSIQCRGAQFAFVVGLITTTLQFFLSFSFDIIALAGPSTIDCLDIYFWCTCHRLLVFFPWICTSCK